MHFPMSLLVHLQRDTSSMVLCLVVALIGSLVVVLALAAASM